MRATRIMVARSKRNSYPPPSASLGTTPLFFEIAWEVCNQIGGIYTVIKTKVPAMLERWHENYVLLGPYKAESAAIEFEEAEPPEALRATLQQLYRAGVRCYFGRWLIPGRPQVILFDHRHRHLILDQDKYFLWRDHAISTPKADPDLNDTISFGFCVFEFFKTLSANISGRPIIAHFHEWMAGVAVPRIRHGQLKVGTVFTTHATLLGRYLAGDNPNFYDEMQHVDPDAAAARYNILSRHQIEKAAAHGAHVFTTISEVTAAEAQKFLGRAPDLILPNGLSVQRFTALHEFQNLHLRYKERIHEFTMGHFFPSYTFDLDRTLYIFTSGRYEYRNKGMDLYIESLYRLNLLLKKLPDPPTIVAFIITQAAVKNINVAALQNHLMFDDLKNTCREFQAGVGQRMLFSVARRRLPTYEDLLPNHFQVRLKRTMYALKSHRLPSIVTHDMVDDAKDAVLGHLRHRGLFNGPGDPVKVIFHPEFITATNPLFNLDYDQFVRGCHLGVFPSYYEPWGYTPLECIALGLPAVTTDLSGFGAFVEHNVPNAKDQGIYVLPRRARAADQSIEDLSNYLFQFSQLSRRERIELRNRSERLTDIFDWSVLASHYHRAHDEALLRAGPWLS